MSEEKRVKKVFDRPNKYHCPDEPIKCHRPSLPSTDDGRNTIKRSIRSSDSYKSVKKTVRDPSKPTLNEPRGVTKESIIPP